jgi:hypothetical protein
MASWMFSHDSRLEHFVSLLVVKEAASLATQVVSNTSLNL